MTRQMFFFVTMLFYLSAISQTEVKSVPGSGNGIVVTLLGTGSPQPLMDRFGPSILVQAGSKTMLFDAGRGCLQRLRQINLGYNSIDALFFTHLHSDHIVGLPDLWLTGWLLTKRKIPLTIFGPEGTKQMADRLQQAYTFDIAIRIADDKAPEEGSRLATTEIKEGIIYEKDNVKVIAFLVDHYPVVPAFGYRVEYGGHSVTIPGDTKFSTNLIKYAKGTDLLIHEVVIAPDTMTNASIGYRAVLHHTNPEQAGKIFDTVKPKLAVYSHIVRFYGCTDEELFSRTRKNYSDSLVIGEDLMRFLVDGTIELHRWKK